MQIVQLKGLLTGLNNNLLIMVRNWIFIFLFSNSLLVMGQQEVAIAHFNKSFYTSGEMVWYKLNLPNSMAGKEATLSVAVFQPNGELIHKDYIQTKGKSSCQGYYKIPYDCRSDVYQFTFSIYEHWTNEPINILEKRIPIYNDLTGQIKTTPNEPLNHQKPSYSNSGLEISISTDQATYNTRSVAQVEVVVRDQEGQTVPSTLSVAVNDQLLTSVDHPLFQTITSNESTTLSDTFTNLIPISGQFKNADNSQLSVKGNIGAQITETNQFMYFQTETNGNFTFEVPHVFGPFQINFKSFIPENLKAALTEPISSQAYSASLPYPAIVQEYIKFSNQRKTIYQLFGSSEFRLNYEPLVDSLLKAPRNVSIWVDEYEAFPDIMTLEKELFLPIRIRERRKGEFTVRLYNSIVDEYYVRGPLFLIDGKMTNDENYFVQLDIEQIEYIHIIYDLEVLRAYFGPFGYNGVIIVESKLGNLSLPPLEQGNVFKINGLQRELIYPFQLENEGQVNISPTIFWHPEIDTNNSGVAEIEVPLGDDQSTFQIEILARDEEGRWGVAHHTIDVLKNQ